MSELERKKVEHSLYLTGIGIIVMLLMTTLIVAKLALPFRQLLFPCVFHQFSGYYCPGCGGTRAVEFFLQGKFLTSFWYHPIVPYTGFIFVWFMISHTIEKISKGKLKTGMHIRYAYLWIALFLVVLNVVVKNLALVVFQLDLLV